MSKVGAEIELFLKKEMEELSKENKKDRHEQNNKIQNIVTLQEQKIEKILNKVEKMYAKKWVEKA
jgi:ribosomal protein S25